MRLDVGLDPPAGGFHGAVDAPAEGGSPVRVLDLGDEREDHLHGVDDLDAVGGLDVQHDGVQQAQRASPFSWYVLTPGKRGFPRPRLLRLVLAPAATSTLLFYCARGMHPVALAALAASGRAAQTAWVPLLLERRVELARLEKSAPALNESLRQLGAYQQANNKLRKAIVAFEEAQRLDPRSLELLETLAGLYEKAGDRKALNVTLGELAKRYEADEDINRLLAVLNRQAALAPRDLAERDETV